jgi:UDP-MurNAc hydroxylase
MAAKTAQVRASAAERLARRVKLTGARMFLPSAGPPVFLDPALSGYNDRDGIFPCWEDIRPGFADAVHGVPVIPPLRASGDVDGYRRARRSEWEAWYAEPDTPAGEDEVRRHFTRLQQVNRQFVAGWRRDVELSDGGRSWNVRLGALSGLLEEAPEPGWRIHVPPRVLRAVLDGRASWETALLSMRLRLHEGPGGFDSSLLGLLQAGHRPAQTRTLASLRDNGEMIRRGGVRFGRWCPHAGEDLAYATVTGGVIECPRHHWQWDAATGKCVAGGDVPLAVARA